MCICCCLYVLGSDMESISYRGSQSKKWEKQCLIEQYIHECT